MHTDSKETLAELVSRLRKKTDKDARDGLERATLAKEVALSKKQMSALRLRWIQLARCEEGQSDYHRDRFNQIWHTFEAAVNKQDLLISTLQSKLENVDEMKRKSYIESIGKIDEWLRIYRRDTEALQCTYEDDRDEMCKQRQQYIDWQKAYCDRCLDNMKTTLHCITLEKNQDICDHKTAWLGLNDEITQNAKRSHVLMQEKTKEKFAAELHLLLATLTNYEESEWRKIRTVMKLETKCKTLTEKIHTNKDILRHLELDIQQLRMRLQEERCKFNVDKLREKRLKLVEHVRNCQRWRTRRQVADGKRMHTLVSASGQAIDHLRQIWAKGERVVKMWLFCVRLQTKGEGRIALSKPRQHMTNMVYRNRDQPFVEAALISGLTDRSMSAAEICDKNYKFWLMTGASSMTYKALLHERQGLLKKNHMLRNRVAMSKYDQ